MKGFFSMVFPFLCILLLTGCTPANTPAGETPSSGSMTSGADESINSGTTTPTPPTNDTTDQISENTNTITFSGERYWTLPADQYTITVLEQEEGGFDMVAYDICPIGNDRCLGITQSTKPFAEYVKQYDTTYDQGTYYSDLVGQKTRTCGQYIMEREICYIDTASGSLSVMVEDAQGGRTYDAKDVLKLIDFKE